MSQITVLNQERRVIDFYIISEDLYQKLNSVAIASSLEFFTIELFEELQSKFLESTITNFNLYNSNQNRIWNLNKAQYYALNLYPWYQDFLSLMNSITQLPSSNSILLIELTSL